MFYRICESRMKNWVGATKCKPRRAAEIEENYEKIDFFSYARTEKNGRKPMPYMSFLAVQTQN